MNWACPSRPWRKLHIPNSVRTRGRSPARCWSRVRYTQKSRRRWRYTLNVETSTKGSTRTRIVEDSVDPGQPHGHEILGDVGGLRKLVTVAVSRESSVRHAPEKELLRAEKNELAFDPRPSITVQAVRSHVSVDTSVA